MLIAIKCSFIQILFLGAALPLLVAGCGGSCPPVQHDDIFPLDVSTDEGPSPGAAADGAVPPDVDAASDARAPDGAAPGAPSAPDGGAAPDGGTPSIPPRMNCGSLAGGCTPGQPCPPACDCVRTRDWWKMNSMAVVDECVLAEGEGPPSIEIRSHVQVSCL